MPTSRRRSRGVAHRVEGGVGRERGEQHLDLRVGEAALAEDGEVLVAQGHRAQPIEEEAQRGDASRPPPPPAGGPGTRGAGSPRRARRPRGAGARGRRWHARSPAASPAWRCATARRASGRSARMSSPAAWMLWKVVALDLDRVDEAADSRRGWSRPEPRVEPDLARGTAPARDERVEGLVADERHQLLVAEPERRPREQRAEVEDRALDPVGEVAQAQRAAARSGSAPTLIDRAPAWSRPWSSRSSCCRTPISRRTQFGMRRNIPSTVEREVLLRRTSSR